MNSKLIYIKLHYFLMMAAYGPILPQLPLFGKDLGISSTVIGGVTGLLPLTFVVIKPLFGVVIDVHRKYRKLIFLSLIITVALSITALFLVRTLNLDSITVQIFPNTTRGGSCKKTISLTCISDCFPQTVSVNLYKNSHEVYEICSVPARGLENLTCDLFCTESGSGSYQTFTFWSVILLLSVVTIGYDLVNSLSDTICFDIIENEGFYGNQRLWGSIGFGLTGLISGFAVDAFSASSLNYTPALITMLVFTVLDLFVCMKLQIPVVPPPNNIFQDLSLVLRRKPVVVFLTFAIVARIFTGLINTFFFWFLEDLAVQTGTKNIKLIEGIILAAENLCAEVIFFSISGTILKRLGHVHSFTFCFFNYFVRLGLMAIVANPWWSLTFEFFMQGPTYALSYAAIMTYAKELAPVGMSGTVQGIAAGLSDGIGIACGRLSAGILYKYFGGKVTFLVFSTTALICAVLHLALNKIISKCNDRSDYEAIK